MEREGIWREEVAGERDDRLRAEEGEGVDLSAKEIWRDAWKVRALNTT